LYLALEIGPNKPEAGDTPFPACHFCTAALVLAPKYVVSIPEEPTPVRDTLYAVVFKYCCKHFTSEPDMPIERLRVKLQFPVAGGGTGVVGCPRSDAFTFAIVVASAPKEVRRESID
jgi:hypothetical protein